MDEKGKRPYLVVYGECSLDGRLTIAPDVLLLFGDERWNAAAGKGNTYEQLLKMHRPQAWLEGSRSFAREGDAPEPLPAASEDPAVLYQDHLPEDIARRDTFQAWFCVVDSRGRVRWYYTGEPGREAPGSPGQHLLVFVTRSTPPDYLSYLRGLHVPYLLAGERQVDLAQALEKMRSVLGVERVISTSPGRLGGALVRLGLVDEIDIDFFPAVIGGSETPTLFDSPVLAPGEMPAKLKLLSAEAQPGGRVWLRYEVIR